MSHSSVRLLDRLRMTCPIVLAPMAGVGTPALAAAVSNAGGLGSLAVGAMGAGKAREAIRQTRALTDKPFNVNVFCHGPARHDEAAERQWLAWLAPHFEKYGASVPDSLTQIYQSFVEDRAMLDVFLEEQPAAVSFHFGLPSDETLAALKRAGIMLIACATSVKEAEKLAEAGVDAIIAQGIEAGGHRGVFDPEAPDERLGTLALTRLLVREFKLPVIATGGIMDGAGIAAALALGAEAAQLGTAFIGCPETSIDEGYRSAIGRVPAGATTLTMAISGRLARGLENRITRLGSDPRSPGVPAYPLAYDAGKALHAAAKARGEFGYGAYWAGQAVGLARSLPASELVRVLIQELKGSAESLGGAARTL